MRCPLSESLRSEARLELAGCLLRRKSYEAALEQFQTIAGKLKDGPRWGYSLEPVTIANLLHTHWAQHFDHVWLLDKDAADGEHQQKHEYVR